MRLYAHKECPRTGSDDGIVLDKASGELSAEQYEMRGSWSQPYDALTHEHPPTPEIAAQVSDALLRRIAIAMWDADDAGRIADGEADMIMPRDNQQVMSEYLGHASAALTALRTPAMDADNSPDYVGLQADLDELEAENPAVAAASQRLDRATARIVADRRDRDELTDRDDLMALAADAYVKALTTAEVPHVWRFVADALIAAGWVHWPHGRNRGALIRENVDLRDEIAALRTHDGIVLDKAIRPREVTG